jgi:hypothetical protein
MPEINVAKIMVNKAKERVVSIGAKSRYLDWRRLTVAVAVMGGAGDVRAPCLYL